MAYTFDIDAAVRRVEKFNGTHALVAADHVMHECCVGTAPPTHPSEAAIKVVLVDGLWATQLFRDEGATDAISERLARCDDKLWLAIDKLGPADLKSKPDAVYETAKPFLKLILTEAGTSKQHYSFATKLLHWCTRQHFPIVDKNARKAINRFQRDQGDDHGRVLAPGFDEDYVEEYRRWTRFYSILLNSLDDKASARLLHADKESLPGPVKIENTLLRVLDKHFYVKA